MRGLSIIILNFNTYALTCACIRSIYNSNLEDIDLEIILVDNGSTEEQSVPFTQIFPKVVYVKSNDNLGFAKGNNLGISHASKTYILFLNSDTIVVDQDVFIKCLDKLNEHDDKIVLTPRLLTEKGQPQVAYGLLPGLLSELMFTTFSYKLLARRQKEKLLLKFVPDKSRIIENGYITATFYLFLAAGIKKLSEGKLYDETFLYGEELFWSTQWVRSGYKMFYFSDVAIVHLVGRSSGATIRTRRKYQTEGEHAYLIWRYGYLTIIPLYFLRIIRFLILSPFDWDIRLRLVVLLKRLFNNKKK